MTQLTSDAASDSLYPAIRDTSVRSPQVMRTSFPNIQCELYSVLPYPHRPLVGRTALLLQRLLFASGPSGTLLAEMRLPDERKSITHKFSVGGHEGYLTVGMYENGDPGEIFIVMAKEGSSVSGLVDSIATLTSIALQYGVPLSVLVNKFSHTRFEPSGFTNNQDIPIAKSIMDYVFRWLALKFMPSDKPEQKEEKDANPKLLTLMSKMEKNEKQTFDVQSDAPSCPTCGGIMVRNGSCYKCLNCGSTSGCS